MFSLVFVIAAAAAASFVLAVPVDISDEANRLSARATPLQFQAVGNSGVSAQQMFLGTTDKVSTHKMMTSHTVPCQDDLPPHLLECI